MAEKVDRRIRKTKSQLKQGLAQLMMKKSINEISVKELVQTVDINRSTFYLHYSDIYSLLDEIEEELLNEIRHIIETHPMGVENNTFTFMEDIFKVLAENKEICRALMGDNGDASFIFKMEDIIEENAKKQLEELFPDIKDNLQYILSFCLSGCMGIVNQWLFQNGQETPEEMAKLMFKMVVHALGIQKYEDLLQS
jgi:AcrR family transcriptional regulator